VIRLDAATVLLQWAVGGLAFLWFTTRQREVGLGYGWLLRGIYAVMAATAFVVGMTFGAVWLREASSLCVALAALFALAVSIRRRRVGVSGQTEEHDRRSQRVAEMTGIERTVAPPTVGREFSPVLDLIAPIAGIVGLVAAGFDAGGNTAVSLLRTFSGAAFLGAVTDAMLLGHWYLTQPGLPRAPIKELVRWAAYVWPVEVVLFLLPPGMVGVVSGAHSDGYGGLLGWMWVVCAITTGVLLVVTWLALRERSYSAVMAATGLMYLAILTGFGMDLLPRALLS